MSKISNIFRFSRRIAYATIGVFSVAALAGCSTVDEFNPFKDDKASAEESVASTEAPADGMSPPTPPVSRPGMKPASVSGKPTGPEAQRPETVMPTATTPSATEGAIPQTASAQPREPITGPAGLIGLGQSAVERHLGMPVIKRESPPAEIWVYDGAECVLNLYFYLNLESQAFETLRYEVVGMGGERPSDSACYDNIVGARG